MSVLHYFSFGYYVLTEFTMLKIVFALFLICFVIERLVPGWKLPHVKTWPIRVVLLNLVQIGVVTLAGYTWELWFSAWSIFICHIIYLLTLVVFLPILSQLLCSIGGIEHVMNLIFYGLGFIRSIIVHKGLRSSHRFTNILAK
ncbi:Uncharacterised protein [Legionella bozemanae]|nr:Uncharacterised protein [Legionella bozemanae]